jgi:hypothetical protein
MYYAALRSQGVADIQSPEGVVMKKHNTRQRRLVLQKEAIQLLSTTRLEAVAGGVESHTIPTLCLTVKTCASFEFAC